jgi:hypothetical protein
VGLVWDVNLFARSVECIIVEGGLSSGQLTLDEDFDSLDKTGVTFWEG